MVLLPAGLILFREFTVSALREVGAGKGVKLPVTMLAKWKTTLQLVAFGAELLVASWPAWDLPSDPETYGLASTTDGVVPYRSAHLDGVPERIVRSDHAVQKDPEAIREVKRILLEHAKAVPQTGPSTDTGVLPVSGERLRR